MQIDNEIRDLKYCRYYHGEQWNPYLDSFKECAWEAEQLASEQAFDEAKDFLSFVVTHIPNRISSGEELNVNRYIAFFEHCSLEEKLEIAREFGLREVFLTEKPKGRTVFEAFWEGTYTPTYGGLFLYYDGRIAVKIGNRYSDDVAYYLLIARDKYVADAVKKLIKENWVAISALPKKSDCLEICDGSYNDYKFLTKRCGGYEYEESEGGKAVKPFHDRILNIFYRTNTPSYEWFESITDVETFAEMWSLLLDEIDADETRAKVYDFIDVRFAEDCQNLGFEMDTFESFYKHCNYDPEKGPEKTFEELLSVCTDYHILGNAIYSQWRYYNHWAYDVKAEFDTQWFRFAFKKILELAR